MSELPPVPLTLEGSYVLHQMFHFDWNAWKEASPEQRQRIETEAAELFGRWEEGSKQEHPNQSAIFSHLGHKGDLILIHFRDSVADLNRVELELVQTGLNTYLRPAHSYISIVELGLYESSAKTYSALAEKGLQIGTPEWDAGIREVVERQSKAMTADASTGEPVFSVIHSPTLKRSSRCTPLLPANRSASFSSSAPSVLTQNTPFWAKSGALLARRLRQTSSVAG